MHRHAEKHIFCFLRGLGLADHLFWGGNTPEKEAVQGVCENGWFASSWPALPASYLRAVGGDEAADV